MTSINQPPTFPVSPTHPLPRWRFQLRDWHTELQDAADVQTPTPVNSNTPLRSASAARSTAGMQSCGPRNREMLQTHTLPAMQFTKGCRAQRRAFLHLRNLQSCASDREMLNSENPCSSPQPRDIKSQPDAQRMLMLDGTYNSSNFSRGQPDVDTPPAADRLHNSRSWIELSLMIPYLNTIDSGRPASSKLSVSLNRHFGPTSSNIKSSSTTKEPAESVIEPARILRKRGVSQG